MLGNVFGRFSGLGAYAKALVAFGGALGTFLVTILAERSITNALPPGWLLALGAVASTLTGVATYAKKNADPDPSAAAQRAQAEAERAAARAEELARRVPTPGDVVDRVIDTARGTLDRWL